jgi:hypothetical protein
MNARRARPLAREAASPTVPEALRSPGHPLEGKLLASFGAGFGHDFSQVRVHSGSLAAASAQSVGAHAYTVADHIVLGATTGQRSAEAREAVLAHELAHVVQQRGQRWVPGSRVDGLHSPLHEAEAAHTAGNVLDGEPAAVSSRVPNGPVLQRLEFEEHRSLGEQATRGMVVNIGGTTPDTQFVISHGDVIALSADYFTPEDLFRLGPIQGSAGTRVGTRDEIVCALRRYGSNDPRFKQGGQWEIFTCSPDVEKAVTDRFNRLAAVNASHFVAPRGRDAQGQPLPTKSGEGTASSAYRQYHERALRMAYDIGRAGTGDLRQAMGMEAAAQHFLTDAFAAGHLTTPIAAIREYWADKYPLFFYNFLNKMALDTAIRMNAQTTNLTTIVGTVQQMYEAIMGQVNRLAASLPRVSAGDLVGKIFHDYDNEMGIAVVGGNRVYGDAFLDKPTPSNAPTNVTRPRAEEAIKTGNTDVTTAFNLGRQGGAALADPALHAAVQAASGAPAGTFLPETRIPQPDPALPGQNWQAADFETLWTQPMLGNSGPTVGDQITRSLQPNGEVRKQLDALASEFAVVERRGSGDVRPREAYVEGFVKPLANNPRAGLLGIIHWAPTYGLRAVDRDDIALSTGQELVRTSRLGGMTTPARVGYIRELIGGSVAGDEEELVVRIFETAPASDRPLIYQQVEGHAWTGDWIHGWTISDDEIFNALNSTRLRRVRDLINAGWTRPAATPTP